MIVVTGAAGFIGSHLVHHLASQGHDVVGIDRRSLGPEAPGIAGSEVAIAERGAAGGAGGIAPVGARARAGPGRITAVVAELASDDRVPELLRAADVVFHLAGAAGVRRSGPDPDGAWWRDNVMATGAVIAATPLPTPLVVTSSSSVYGGSTGGRPSREVDQLAPRGGYARSKAVVEHLCSARRDRGGHVAVARPFTVAGEGQRPDMALSRWIRAAVHGDPLPVYGSLARRRDITDVREVARALDAMAWRQVTGPLNLGTGVSHSLGELVEAVAAAVGPVEVAVQPGSADEVETTLADTTRCARLLGFVPTTDLGDLVRRQAAASAVEVEVEARSAAGAGAPDTARPVRVVA